MTDLVTTTVNYALPPADGARPIQKYNFNPTSRERDRNFPPQSQEIQVENIRGKEDTVSLDTTGFQFYTIPTKYKGEFLDDEEIKREYYPESEELIKNLTGASKVFIFNHVVRRHKPDQTYRPEERQPSHHVHVDQTFADSIARVHRYLPPDEAPGLLERRFQIINLWRPISVPALEWPLAFCDFRSVDPKNDVFAVAFTYPDSDIETEACAVKYNPNHKWKYVRGMTPDEFVLLKCTESIQDGSVAEFTPHTAFDDPTTPKGAPHRESIELRTLVFYD